MSFVKSFTRRTGRGFTTVRAFSRKSSSLIPKPGHQTITTSSLRGRKLTVKKGMTVNFASGPVKYVEITGQHRGYKGRIENFTREVKQRDFRPHRGAVQGRGRIRKVGNLYK